MSCKACKFYLPPQCLFLGGTTKPDGFCEGWLDAKKEWPRDFSMFVDGTCPKCGEMMIRAFGSGFMCIAASCDWMHEFEVKK